MQVNASTCIKRVGGNAICSHCNGKLIKHGICNSGKLRYKCKNCKKTQVENYTYNAYHQSINQQIYLIYTHLNLIFLASMGVEPMTSGYEFDNFKKQSKLSLVFT